MPLKLRLKIDSSLPIDVRHLSAAVSRGLNTAEVARLPVFVGKRSCSAEEMFDIAGDLTADRQLEFSGKLSVVHSIGRGLTNGCIVVQSSAGRHVGTAMSGGQITVQGDVGDYLGAQMTGGKIHVSGSAGDFAAAALEGSAYGNNRGEILIQGNAGVGLGKRMRRGMVIVGGDVGELAAWNMLAGTIVVLGRALDKAATDIKRGTVILAGEKKPAGSDQLGAAFSPCGTGQPQIVQFLGAWIKRNYPEKLSPAVQQKLLGRSFIKYNGGDLNLNRAEIFVAV